MFYNKKYIAINVLPKTLPHFEHRYSIILAIFWSRSEGPLLWASLWGAGAWEIKCHPTQKRACKKHYPVSLYSCSLDLVPWTLCVFSRVKMTMKGKQCVDPGYQRPQDSSTRDTKKRAFKTAWESGKNNGINVRKSIWGGLMAVCLSL